MPGCQTFLPHPPHRIVDGNLDCDLQYLDLGSGIVMEGREVGKGSGIEMKGGYGGYGATL